MRAKTRWLALLLAVWMLALSGCGKTAGNKEESAAVVQAATETAGETTEPVQETEEPAEETAKPAEPDGSAETAESTKPAEAEAAEAEPHVADKADQKGPDEPEEAAAEVAGEAQAETPAEEPETAESTLLVTEAPEETETGSGTLAAEEPAIDGPEVQRTIEITVPAEYADVRYRIGEVTWNPDDSATYRLTEEEHARLLAEVRSDIQQELNEMCTAPNFLDFFSIQANEDCSAFTVVCVSIETTMAEQESLAQLYEYGKKFAAYEGKEPGNIHIDFMTKIGNTFVMRDSEQDERQASS